MKTKKIIGTCIVVGITCGVCFVFAGITAISGVDMEPTIKQGDHVIFAKRWLGKDRAPTTGSLITFPDAENRNGLVTSRVAAVAGDKIRVIDNYLFINDEKQSRLDQNDRRDILSELGSDLSQLHLYQESLQPVNHWVVLDLSAPPEKRNFPENHQPFVVPADSVFVMADNRNISINSKTWGVIQLDRIVGEPLFVGWSYFVAAGEIQSTIRWDRIGFQIR